MEIKYLQKMQANPVLKRWVNEGLSEPAIIALEQKYNGGKPFPTALREFLFLGGESNNIGFDSHDSMDVLQQRAKENLDYVNLKIERPFFAFDHLDDCSQFTFVYLDEDQDDPDVYLGQPFYVNEGSNLIDRYARYTFSSLVNDHIYRILNNKSMD